MNGNKANSGQTRQAKRYITRAVFQYHHTNAINGGPSAKTISSERRRNCIG